MPYGYCWKIQRRKKPMGVKLTEGGFRSFAAADAAGKDALQELLQRIHDDGARGKFGFKLEKMNREFVLFSQSELKGLTVVPLI